MKYVTTGPMVNIGATQFADRCTMGEDLLEKKVKDAVKAVLKNWGCYQFWPIKTSAMGAITVDCLACIPVRITEDMVGTTLGVFVAIETKRTKLSEPTKPQEHILKQVMEAAGGAVLVHTVHDIEIEDGLAKAILERGDAKSWVTIGARASKGSLT